MPAQASILSHSHAVNLRSARSSTTAILRNSPETIVRVSGEKIVAHYTIPQVGGLEQRRTGLHRIVQNGIVRLGIGARETR